MNEEKIAVQRQVRELEQKVAAGEISEAESKQSLVALEKKKQGEVEANSDTALAQIETWL